MKKLVFIVNPISGIGRQKGIEKLARRYLNPAQFDFSFIYTTGPGQGTELTNKALLAGADIVAAVGGDGSVNQIAKALAGKDQQLAIIPTGSGNGLARYLNIPLNPVHSISALNHGKSMKVDTMTVNNSFFVSIAGVGFDALVADQFSKQKRRGFLTYLNVSLKEYFRYESVNYQLTIDGVSMEKKALIIGFANSNQFGYNTAIAPHARVDDGLIDVCIIEKPSFLAMPRIAHVLFTNKFDR